jgi:hypothetical protein
MDPLESCVVSAKFESDPKDIIRIEAEMFFRAGGCISLTDWRLLSDSSKLIMIEAKANIDKERFVGMLGGKATTEREVVSAMADKAERAVAP